MADVAALPINTGVATLTPAVADAGAAAPPADDQQDQGDQGDTGDQGDQGDQGDAGDEGDQGDQKDDQTQGDTGDKDVTDQGKKDLSQKQVNEKLKELAKTDPALAKALKPAFNENTQYKQIYPTVADAKAAKELLTGLGENPSEAIQNLRQAEINLADIDAAIDSSDPDFIAALFENHKDGAEGLIGPGLIQLHKSNPDKYQQVMAPAIYNSYRSQNGPVAYMKAAADAIALKTPEGYAKAAQILESFGEQMTALEDFIKSSQTDPLKGEREKIANERKKLTEDGVKNFNASIDARIFPVRDSIISKALEPYTKGKTIDADRLTLIKKNVLGELQAFAEADKNFNTQYNTWRNTNDLEKIIKFTGTKLEEVLPGMVDKVAKHFGLSTSQGRPGIKDRQRTVIKGDSKGTSGGNKGAVEGSRENPIKSEPEMRNIDTRRTSTLMRIRQKQAWGKDGKFYSWGN